jgi:hypothetical protein
MHDYKSIFKEFVQVYIEDICQEEKDTVQVLSDDMGMAIASRVARASQRTPPKACKGIKLHGSRPWHL